MVQHQHTHRRGRSFSISEKLCFDGAVRGRSKHCNLAGFRPHCHPSRSISRFPYTEKDHQIVHGWNSAPWIREELSRRGLKPLVSPEKIINGDNCVRKENLETKGSHSNCQKREELEALEVEALSSRNLNYQKFREDIALVSLLKDCARRKDLIRGSSLHADILKKGLVTQNIFIGNTLVNMYAKCGALLEAQQVFDKLPVRNVVSWNALIAGYSGHGHGEEALDCFERMEQEGFSADAVTFACSLKACGSIGAAKKGKEIHAEIVREGLLGNDCVLGSALIDMYVKCCALASAQEVFDKLPVRDVVCWTAIISGIAQHGQVEEALIYFAQMRCEGLSPNAVTCLCILKVCSSIGALEKGKQVHAEIVRGGFLRTESMLVDALVDMYAKCGALAEAQEAFDELPVNKLASWNTLIAGYSQHGYGREALNKFQQMQQEGFSPDGVTFLCVLKACGIIGAAEKSKEIHAEVVRRGLLGENTVLGNALIDTYAKCGEFAKAQQVLDELPVRDVVSWTAVIAGYAQHGHGGEALRCFRKMQREGLSPNAVTFLCILKACRSIGAADTGKEIHAEIVREGLLGKNIELGNALVDMYAKFGSVAKAQQVFDKLPIRSIVSWNTLIGGYSQHGHGVEAFKCLEQMQDDGFLPDEVTFTSILKACGSTGAVEKGDEIHAEIIREGLLGKNRVLGNALVDMYAKCGALAKAQQVSDELPFRDLYTWNCLISGYSQQGCSKQAINCFEEMQCEGLIPNAVTFLCVLNVCSSSGLVEEGQTYFETMSSSHGIIPALEHYTCMVDLFGRGGHFDKAMAVIKKLPSSHHLPLWSALLSACRQWGNVKAGKLAFQHAAQLDESYAVAYVYMRDIFAAAGMPEDADKVEAMRMKLKHEKLSMK